MSPAAVSASAAADVGAQGVPAILASAQAPVPVASAPAVAAPAPLTRPALVAQSSLNGADTAWMMTATALVLLMTLPGIALFYGGMVRKKSVINTMASVVAIAAVVTLLWFAFGYSLAFTPGNGWIGGTSRFWFEGLSYLKDAGKVSVSHIAPNIPESVFSMFQLTFAIITPALIVGAFVERMKFSAMLWFIVLWSLLVYAPVAHWVWEPGGWIARMGALDFAGGTVVHVNAGIAGLMVAITPAAGFVTPGSAVVIGGIAGLACYWGATGLKRLLQADDSLDVFGVHGIGGIVGSLLTGLLASPLVSGVQGSVATQALATLVVLAYGAVMSAVLLIVIRKLVGLRVDESAEQTGLDIAQHRERIGT